MFLLCIVYRWQYQVRLIPCSIWVLFMRVHITDDIGSIVSTFQMVTSTLCPRSLTHRRIHSFIRISNLPHHSTPTPPYAPAYSQSNIHSATQTQALSQMTNHKFAPFFTLGPEMVAVTLFRWKCMSPSTLSNEKKESIKNSDFFLFIHTRGSRQQQDK